VSQPSSAPARQRPRLGFLGTGWIGLNRMRAIQEAGCAEIIGIADPSAEMAAEAAKLAPGAAVVDGIDALLDLRLDGLVIATPSALHAAQSSHALNRGVAVFCQKPLGRTAAETRAVVETARRADLLLGVDLSYRATAGMRLIRDRVRAGELGRVYAADLVFHNAYGPDKPWFYDAAQSGGGCLMDLGVHLVDLALWTLDWPRVTEVSGRLFARGDALGPDPAGVEDFAVATIGLESGGIVRLACSWGMHAGQDAVISAGFHGTEGGATMRNLDGSFYDFATEIHHGTARQVVATPPDAWGGRTAVEWANTLAEGNRFDADALRLTEVAVVLDRLYGR
jgi:predicted dehydrogenase